MITFGLRSIPQFSFTLLLSTLALFYISTTTTHAAVTPDDPGNFITTWNTENPGTSNDNQITIPGTGGGYNYEIYWENVASSTQNGTTTLITTDSHTLTFPEPGIYEVQASGTFPRIFFHNSGDKDKILTVEQWGNIVWSNMKLAFRGASNLRVPATDAPDLSGVTSMKNMFRDATSFNDPINHWDVSNVEDMFWMFRGAKAFNQPLDNWDVSNVTTMEKMFLVADSFNQPLNDWDVSNVTSMNYMFGGAHSFNQPLDNWDVSSVVTASGMFKGSDFNQDLSSWNITSIRDTGSFPINGMHDMFTDTGLSQQNQDATLTSWATQAASSTIEDIRLHIGVKSYSQTGADAIATLESLGWTISEQYQARYRVDPGATLSGSNHQFPLNSGATTTAVEIKPDSNCTFRQWSDGNTDNSRTDVLISDNLIVTAEIRCSSSSSGTSASGRATALERQGKDAEAAAIRERFELDDHTTTSTPAKEYQPPETLEESLGEVERLPETIDRIVANDPSPETIRSLIGILLALVEALGQLLVSGERA